MAILKKITMYVCDLEGNLSTATLNDMIDNYVLNRISTNGFCLLKEEKSKEVEWGDDYPLNNCDISNNPDEWEKCLDNEYRNLSQNTATCDKFTLTAEEVKIAREALLYTKGAYDGKVALGLGGFRNLEDYKQSSVDMTNLLTRIKQWQNECNNK